MRLTAFATATAFALCLAAGWAQAQTKGQPKGQPPASPAQPQADEGQRFDDWVVRCEQPPQGGGERCFMGQSFAAQNDEGKRIPLLVVAIGYGESDGQQIAVMQFTVPLGLYLPAGIALQIDQAQPIRIAIEVCSAQACIARYRLDDAVRTAMQKGQQAKIQLVRANKQAMDIPLSLKGFTKAFAAVK